MNNAEKFRQVFGYFSSEIWAMPEKSFCDWMGARYLEQKEEAPKGWEEVKDDDYSGGGFFKCPCCGYGFSFGMFPMIYEFDYCPHCGKLVKR